ncbi:STE3-domain-containing protein [Dendrothele bispora CBS 962.96]|uniref:STE3-domain-containing protein n=1 Tax=Dendrothele bispora (strain CBS 962.96) TaxID=1314807 RepID=A0A4S8L5F0_DENBC|nr:STE3-domain-containing protein [Dendrothele bispora CBS 962.96]
MYDPTYPAFPVMAFVAFVLVLIPLPWHLQAWNSGTCLFMIWTALGCLNLFINSIIWRNDAIDRAPVWCDISSALMVAINVALPAASLCINRRLYKIASCQTASVTLRDKRREVIIDLAIGVGIPLLQIPLHYIVQGHRYDLIEQVGCWGTTFNTIPAYPLSFLWPNIIGLVSMIYGVLTLRAFMRRRQQFSQFLSSSGGMNISRYFRLMCLAMMEIVINTPISSFGLYLNITHSKIHPWVSWENTHFGFGLIDTYPAILWRSNSLTVATLELTRWSFVVAAFIFFGFFGFAEEARKHYRLAYQFVGKRLGLSFPSSTHSFHFWDKNKSGHIPMSNSPNAPRSLVLPQLKTISSMRDSSSVHSVAATSIRKSEIRSDYSTSPIVQSPPPMYRLESYPSTPASTSSSFSATTTHHEQHPHSPDGRVPQAVAL